MRLADLFAPPAAARRRETTLQPGEIITALTLPTAGRSTYLKAMDRKTWAFALVGVAVRVQQEGGRIAEARVVLSGVANVPWRASEAEQVLTGQAPDGDLLAAAADAAVRRHTTSASLGACLRKPPKRAWRICPAEPGRSATQP